MKSLCNNDFFSLIMLSFITEVCLHNFCILFFYGKLQKLVNLKENCFYGYAFGSLRKKISSVVLKTWFPYQQKCHHLGNSEIKTLRPQPSPMNQKLIGDPALSISVNPPDISDVHQSFRTTDLDYFPLD